MNFYITEENQAWTLCNAKSLKGAKIAAKKLQAYVGTKLYVSIKDDNGLFQTLSSWQEGCWCDTPAVDYI